MKLFDKIKKNRSYKIVIIVFVLIAVFISISDKKEAVTQETCNTANTWGPILPCYWNNALVQELTENTCMFNSPIPFFDVPQSSIDECISISCVMGFESKTVNTYGCFSCVPNGIRATNSNDCCGKAKQTDDGEYGYLCMAEEEDEKCNESEKGIAEFVQSIGLFTDNCKFAYYAAIFGGFMMMLIVFAAI